MSFIVDQYYTYQLQNGRYAPILLELSALEQQHSQFNELSVCIRKLFLKP